MCPPTANPAVNVPAPERLYLLELKLPPEDHVLPLNFSVEEAVKPPKDNAALWEPQPAWDRLSLGKFQELLVDQEVPLNLFVLSVLSFKI